MKPVTLRLLEWNQGDDGVSPNNGWDIACLTERSPHPPANRYERFTSRRLKGLAIDHDPDVFDVHERGAKIAHLGFPGFSPIRGTLYEAGLYAGIVPVAAMCSHRLNDPDGSDRVGGPVRSVLWRVHAALDARIARRLEKRGYVVVYGGDINDHRARLTPLIRELEGHYDAIGYSRDPRIRLLGIVNGGKHGSDHGQFTATFALKEHR